jgi:hypothetical protein
MFNDLTNFNFTEINFVDLAIDDGVVYVAD